MVENKSNLIKENFNLVYKRCFENDSLIELQKFCTKIVAYEPEKFFNSNDYITFSEKSLISLIQNDDIQASDVQIWEYVLKWGLVQNPELPPDPEYSDTTIIDKADILFSKKIDTRMYTGTMIIDMS